MRRKNSSFFLSLSQLKWVKFCYNVYSFLSRLNAFENCFCAIHTKKTIRNVFIFNVSDAVLSLFCLLLSFSRFSFYLSLAHTLLYAYLAESTTINWIQIVQPENVAHVLSLYWYIHCISIQCLLACLVCCVYVFRLVFFYVPFFLSFRLSQSS